MSAARWRAPNAERLKFFTDAVVAIAMTLLILPLMESVTDAGGEDHTTSRWLADHTWQMISFVLSFAVVASFWRQHHHVFRTVERYTPRLERLNLLWMLIVVWLPVPTAILGALPRDRPQMAVYLGTLVALSAATVALVAELRAHPELREDATDAPVDLRRGLADGIASTILLATAMVVALALPVVSYWALFLLFLTNPVRRLLMRTRLV